MAGRAVALDDAVLDSYVRELQGLGPAPPARRAYAAAHVVMHASYAGEESTSTSVIAEHIDWGATRALRERFGTLGLGVAEAMDTAQRFELGWPSAMRLIEECAGLAPELPFIAGASTDHLEHVRCKDDLVGGVAEQAGFIRDRGGEPILLPMPWLSVERCGADDYVEVYRGIVERSDGPVWIHWLGEMFLPSLRGYFPGDSFERVLALDREKVRGVKLSLLDAEREVAIRRALAPHGQLVFSGDDLHFADLIAGDGEGYSHALLGILDAIARPASVALQLLAHGRRERFLELMRPCEELGRHVFAAPTQNYKAGLAFLAWLNGLQESPLLPFHLERERDRDHYLRCAELASACGAIEDATLAAERLTIIAGS